MNLGPWVKAYRSGVNVGGGSHDGWREKKEGDVGETGGGEREIEGDSGVALRD